VAVQSRMLVAEVAVLVKYTQELRGEPVVVVLAVP
jgi:hypothetical protein